MENQNAPEREFSYSFVLGKTEEPTNEETKGFESDFKANYSDATILEELKLTGSEVIIFDISSLITVVEEKEKKPYGGFKCYLNKETNGFFIEINEMTPIKVFTRSILLNLFDFAEKNGAKVVYACLRKSAKEIAQYAQSFLFVGFEFLEEQNKTETHIILRMNLNNKEDENNKEMDSENE